MKATSRQTAVQDREGNRRVGAWQGCRDAQARAQLVAAALSSAKAWCGSGLPGLQARREGFAAGKQAVMPARQMAGTAQFQRKNSRGSAPSASGAPAAPPAAGPPIRVSSAICSTPVEGSACSQQPATRTHAPVAQQKHCTVCLCTPCPCAALPSFPPASGRAQAQQRPLPRGQTGQRSRLEAPGLWGAAPLPPGAGAGR